MHSGFWSWRGLGTIWALGIFLALVLVAAGRAQRPLRFIWMMPHLDSLSAVGHFLQRLFSLRPLEASALILIRRC
jgi:hypothetical protein